MVLVLLLDHRQVCFQATIDVVVTQLLKASGRNDQWMARRQAGEE